MRGFDSLLKRKLCRLFHLSFTFVGVFLLVIPLSTGVVYSAQVTLAWNPNTEKDLAGYKIYYGTSSGNYDASVDVGNWTSCTIAELEEGQTYYFGATAYDFDGNESDFSSEVTWANDAESDSILLKANFDADDDGFTYVDDPFRDTSEPSYAHGVQVASGGFKGGALQVTLGGINYADILGMSGGWKRSFTLNISTEVVLSFRYKLTQASDYENDEYSQVLVSVDGTLYGQGSKDYVAQITGNGNGGSVETTGWKSSEVNLGTLTAGNYTLAFGGYNNKKTYNNESTEVLIDEVLVTGMVAEGTNSPPSKPTNPSPSNGAGGRSIDTVLGWTSGGGATSYDIYFGTDSSPDSGEFMGNQTATTFDLGTLDYDTTYYWRIDASNLEGTTTGDIWSFTTASGQGSPPEVIVDNDDPGTSSTGGEWGYSSGLMPYGGTSRTEMRQGATYTFEASISGHHLVSLWWTYYSSRCTNVRVGIYDVDSLLATVYVDQKKNGSQWNVLGTYSFSGTAKVRIFSESSGCSTCADAVRFLEVSPPTAEPPSKPANPSPSDGAGGRSIDTVLGWTNGGGATSYDVYFGTDSSPDSSWFMGNQPSNPFDPGTLDYDTTYYWRIDASNSEGTTTGDIWSFTTASGQDSPTEVIVDNDDPGTSSTGGEWGYSSGLMPYGGTSRTEMRQGATYTFEASISGHHLVSLWWTYWRSRCANVPVDIYDGTALLDTVVVNHRENDGQWNPLGVYLFSSGTARVVVRSQSSGCSTCADAVKFVNQ